MDYSITNICAPYKSVGISISLQPVKVPYFTNLEIRSPTGTIFERTYSDYCVTKDLVDILRIPDLKIDQLDIGGLVFNQKEFFSRVIKALEENSLKIRAETVHFHVTNKQLTKKHVELLRHFDVDALHGIEINTHVLDDAFQEMVTTEQWKKAKRLTMFQFTNSVGIENFLHFQKVFLIDYPKITPNDCWKMIQSFRNGNIPPGSFFDISGTKVDISGVIEMFDVPVRCEDRDSEYVKHIQHFKLEDDYILEVRLYEDKILSRKGKKEDLLEF
uniref:FTH domain-containing protein n=1 Tax=Caenorhabditis tropicalis TaxID=1561998 RepID=A0A1I7V325_9PELO